jgi:hypothetical protein
VSDTVASLRRQFVEADRKEAHSGEYEDWLAWQRLGAAYFVMTHPESAPYHNLDPQRLPTVQEIRALADQLNHAMDGVSSTWRIWPWTNARIEHSARVAWFHELMTALYSPVAVALSEVRHGETARLETLLRFLEADPYCHRSGYMKADIINALTRVPVTDRDRIRLRSVLIDVLGKPTKREFRRYVRLARYLDSEDLRATLTDLASGHGSDAARHATWILSELPRQGHADPPVGRNQR